MSIGIAYRVRLARPELFPDLVHHVNAQCEVRGWQRADAEAEHLPRARVRAIDGTIVDRDAILLGGVWVNPHFGADDLCLVFDRGVGDLIDPSRGDGASPRTVNGFALTRTTYADAATHVALIALLEDLAERGLASVELGDPDGGTLPRDRDTAAARIRLDRIAALRETLARPHEPISLGGVARFLSPAAIGERRMNPPGPLQLLEKREAEALLRARDGLYAAWSEQAPELTATPEIAIAALERLTDLALSSPAHRKDPKYLTETFVWEVGAAFGFLLIEACGGYWERVEGTDGSRLQVANLGGVGLTWQPMRSAVDRIHQGPLYAHDGVLAWLRGMIESANAVFAQ